MSYSNNVFKSYEIIERYNDFTSKLLYEKFITDIISLVTLSLTLIYYFYLMIRIKNHNSNLEKLKNSFVSQRAESDSFYQSVTKTDLLVEPTGGKKSFSLVNFCMLGLLISNFGSCLQSLICNSIYSNGFLFQNDKTQTDCMIYGFLYNLFDLSMVIWTTIITTVFFTSSFGRVIEKETEPVFKITGLVLGIFFPLFFTSIPLYLESYGPAELYCTFDYFNLDNKTFIWLLVESFISFGLLAYCFVITIVVLVKYAKILKHSMFKNSANFWLLVRYIVIFTVLPVNTLISRLMKIIAKMAGEDPSQGNYEIPGNLKRNLIHISNVLYSLNGVLNSLCCFLFQKEIFDLIQCCNIRINPILDYDNYNKYLDDDSSVIVENRRTLSIEKITFD